MTLLHMEKEVCEHSWRLYMIIMDMGQDIPGHCVRDISWFWYSVGVVHEEISR